MAEPHFLAVVVLGGALVAHAVFCIFPIVLKSEGHAGDVAALHQLQRIVGVVGIWKVAAAFDMVGCKSQRECAFAVHATAQHVGHHTGVVQIENHVGALQ